MVVHIYAARIGVVLRRRTEARKKRGQAGCGCANNEIPPRGPRGVRGIHIVSFHGVILGTDTEF
jgi:hypothetical protein